MDKMSNYCREKPHNFVTRSLKYSFFQAIVSPITAISLCLSATLATSAQHPPKAAQANIQRPTSSASVRLSSGSQISLNGRTLSGAWLQQPGGANQVTTLISDGALRQFIGVDLLNSNNPARQPVVWFSSTTQPLVLTTKLQGGYRYLDVTNLVRTAGWQVQAQGNTLAIATPPGQVRNIRQSQRPENTGVPSLPVTRIVVDLDRPTPWQVRQGQPIRPPADPNSPDVPPPAPTHREWTIVLDGIADAALIQRYTPLPTEPNLFKQLPTPEPMVTKVEVVNNQTLISLRVPLALFPRLATINNPDRLIIDLRPDALDARDIAWATGIHWRQQFVNLDTNRFPVVLLEINPRTVGLSLRPILTSPNTLVGTDPLIQMAQRYSAIGAINGGYFNRNNRYPLGAVRQDGRWLSSPILNRGAIAWNDAGQFYFGRLSLQETLVTSTNLRLPILFLNSGYVQTGMARYTTAWGQTYTPLTDNERIFIVQNNKITNQLAGDKAGQSNFPIPKDGYLLTLRGNNNAIASQLVIGKDVQITSSTIPGDFNRYPHIIGAGPLLVQNNQIVLDAESEKFSKAFIIERAVRSGICTTTNNTLLIATVHNRAGGPGPNLAEHAQLMKQLGCVNALNLDGGSSTSLYLSGQLLDRYPNTAARVHNGIGIFLQPR
ncbi:phosphodiester glycosidase family protein [Anabaena subtropica]|uniref:Phosphodiester glycosidase family protein n=1 Tax=Anabaena subtropica FACHB-260 TaxID=2692884 RepID=A0ABR8CP96_9NOST|nr:phosphodiester glycosidase family protein [Anabaena subtropica]MBD2345022.1 phosphodiester glycosidase family protein [Anabaena subtropica FACHB-260]